MSSAAAAKWKPKKRSFNESFLSTLSSPPNVICNDTDNVYNGNVANMSTYELKSTLKKLKDICTTNSIADDTDDESIIYQPSHKRAKQTTPNILYPRILQFVERVVHQRYTDNNNRSNCPHFTFLQNELRSQFGTKDIVFQAEEDIINLVFELVVYCIKQRVEDINKSTDTMDSVGYTSDSVVKRGLQIVDIIVQYDQIERVIRTRLYQSRNNKEDHPSSVLVGSTDEGRRSRRSKYEHLLQPKKKKKKCKTKSQNTSAADNVKTCMEETFPDQWNWLCQIRSESKIQSTDEGTEELQQLHYSEKKSSTNVSPSAAQRAGEVPGDSNFVIIKRRIETLDDISISSTESDDEELDVEMEIVDTGIQEQKDASTSTSTQHEETNKDTATSNILTAPLANPFEKLDKETNNLRLTLVDMPASEASSAEVIRHTQLEIQKLLSRYGEADGASGITRCGEIFSGQHVLDTSKDDQASESTQTFPINDAMVASLVKTFLTDAMGALRAKAFLQAFVLPLMVDMNPTAKVLSSEVQTTKSSKGKPASRVLISLLTSLARDRPTECVVSVLVPTLVLKKYLPSSTAAHESLFEPTRFQCELISRLLKGRDALSAAAITLFVEELLTTSDEIKSSLNDAQVRGGMKWTDNTMPLLSACLNRQPDLPDNVVSRLADEIFYQLSSKASPSMVKSMKLSTLFHTFVTKYGVQVKSTGKVESLKDSCKLLKTFMSKTISMALKKIS